MMSQSDLPSSGEPSCERYCGCWVMSIGELLALRCERLRQGRMKV